MTPVPILGTTGMKKRVLTVPLSCFSVSAKARSIVFSLAAPARYGISIIAAPFSEANMMRGLLSLNSSTRRITSR